MDNYNVIYWGKGTGNLVLDSSIGPGFPSTLLRVIGLSPQELTYSKVGNSLIVSSPFGATIEILNHSSSVPQFVQYYEKTGEWFGTPVDELFEGVSGQHDFYVGERGNDTYVWGLGSGDDVIQNWESGFEGHDVVEIKGFTPSEVSLVADGRDLLITGIGGETLRVLHHVADLHSAINEIVFENGVVWGADVITANTVVNHEGTAADEELRGSDAADVMDGKGGNDLLIGLGGNDTYVWGLGSGRDTVQNWEATLTSFDVVQVKGFSPTDVNLVVEGRDLVIYSNTGESLRILNHAKDEYSAVNEIYFEDGTHWGQSEIETHSSDTYLWGLNFGDLTVENINNNGFEGLTLKITGLTPSELTYEKVGSDLIITSQAGDTLTIINHTIDSTAFRQYFEDTGEWFGTPVDELFEGVSGQHDFYVGERGNDTYVWGLGSGDDVIQNWESGFEGHDVVEIKGFTPSEVSLVADGRDLLITGIGGETLRLLHHVADLHSAINEIVFENGVVWGADVITANTVVNHEGTAADEELRGSDAADVMDGKGGNDLLIGLGGNDTYVWGLGSGRDTVQNWEATLTSFDVVQVKGFSPTDVNLVVEGRDLDIYSNTGETLRILNHAKDEYSAVNEIYFEDGTHWGQSEIETHSSDTYLWGLNFGDLTVENINNNGFEGLTLKITGLTPSELTYEKVGSDLIITSQAGDTLTIINHTIDSTAFRQYFEDTGEWFGTPVDELFEGVSGQHDFYVGERGNDTYVWGLGSGDDVIQNWESGFEGHDVVEIKGFTPSEVSLVADGRDLLITGIGGETLRVLHHVADLHSAINEIVFENGVVWGADVITANTVVNHEGTAADEELRGSDAADVMDGKGGNDLLIGLGGNDTYVWGLGSGRDTVQNWEATLTSFDVVQVKGFSPTDVNLVVEGRDLVIYSNTGESLRILNHAKDEYSAVNEIYFEDGTHWGQSEIETHSSDTYLWGLNFGDLTVENINNNGFEGLTLKITGLTPSELTYEKVGSDLIITSQAGDTLTIINHTIDSTAFRQYFEDTGEWFGTPVDELFEGVSGQHDFYVGERGNDTYVWGLGSGDDVIQNWESGFEGHDVVEIKGFTPSEVSLVADGRDLLITGIGGETLRVLHHVADLHSAINEIVFENGVVWGADVITANTVVNHEGTAADEELRGSDAADVMDGKGGNDLLIGLGGNDTYVWGLGSGRDTVQNWEATLTSFDVVQVKGFSPTDVNLVVEGRDLVIYSNTGESLRILNHAKDEYSAVNEIYFEDGTHWGQSEIETHSSDTYLWGLNFGDLTVENINNNGFEGLTLKITGLTPSELTYEKVGSDLIITSQAGDTLTIINHTIDSTAFRQYFEDTGEWFGTPVDELFEGVSGQHDFYVGERGNDTYVWGLGSGDDVIQNWESGFEGHDVVEIKGFTPSEVSLVADGRDLLITGIGGETLRVLHHVADLHSAINEIVFENGVVWGADVITANTVVNHEGTAADEELRGSDAADVMDGKGGNDLLIGLGGNDTYVWGLGSGRDTVQNWEATLTSFDVVQVKGFSPTDVNLVVEGRDLVIYSNTGESLRILNHAKDEYSAVNEIYFEDGTHWGQSEIETHSSDTYLWGLNFGDLTVENINNNGFEGLTLKITGLTPSELTYEKVGSDLIITSQAGDTLTIINHTIDSTAFRQYFEDTGEWFGTPVDELFEGVSGQHDFYVGERGNDTYVWGLGSGDDVIQNWESGFEGHDVVEIKGFTPSEVSLVADGRDLLITGIGGETLRVLHHVADLHSAINEIVFENGVVWGADVITANTVVNHEGTAADEELRGSDAADVMDGKGGNDLLIGLGGNDTYVWGLNSGSDTIQNWEAGYDGNDIVKVVGLVPADVQLIVEGRDLVLVSSTGESLRILNHVADSHSAINSIEFADGTVWGQEYISENALHLQSGSINNDFLIGGSNPDLLIGKAGSDLLLGKSGNDVLKGDAGDDALFGGSGNDLIIGGVDNDIMFGRSIEGEVNLLEVNTFAWRESDKGDVANPDEDVIADFRLGHDLIDLKDLLVGENADNIDMYLNIYSNASDTYIEINSTGNLSTLGSEQIIKLQNVDLSGSVDSLESLFASIIIDE